MDYLEWNDKAHHWVISSTYFLLPGIHAYLSFQPDKRGNFTSHKDKIVDSKYMSFVIRLFFDLFY